MAYTYEDLTDENKPHRHRQTFTGPTENGKRHTDCENKQDGGQL